MTNSAKHQSTVIPVILIFLSLMSYQMMSAQPLSGTIIDSETRNPMANVHIGISSKGIGTISDEKGHFNLQVMFEKTLRWRMVLIFEEMEVIKACSVSSSMGLQLKWKAPDASGGQTATVVGQGGFAFTHQRHRPLHFLMNFTKARNRFASLLDDGTTFFS